MLKTLKYAGNMLMVVLNTHIYKSCVLWLILLIVQCNSMDIKFNTKACLFLVAAQLVPVTKYKPSILNNANTRKYEIMHEITMVQYSDLIRKSNRAKHPLSAKRNDFLWSI
jgi:hypothetical protein